MPTITPRQRSTTLGAMREVPTEMAANLDAAADALLADFDDIQMHDIAVAAGVARSSLYYYFTNKDDVLEYLLRSMLDELAEATAAAVAGPGDPSIRLAEVIRAQLGHLNAHPAASQLLIANLGRAGKLPDIAARINAGFQETRPPPPRRRCRRRNAPPPRRRPPRRHRVVRSRPRDRSTRHRRRRLHRRRRHHEDDRADVLAWHRSRPPRTIELTLPAPCCSDARPSLSSRLWSVWPPLGSPSRSPDPVTTGELQRAALDELGLPVGMESSPIIGPVLDDITEQITRRMINESRASATVAALLGIVVAVGVGSGMDLLESHRRARQPDNRAGSTSAELHDGDR